MIDLYWMTVGNISDMAIQSINDTGGKVVHIQAKGDIPAIYLIGIPCQFFSSNTNDVQIQGWNELFIKVPSFGLSFTLSSQLHKKTLHIIQVPIHKTSLTLINEKV